MKEFDIFLNNRLTECDIIVYSIPYRDGLTAMNKMILESCVESCKLAMFVAVQTGSELVAHIDDMLKICYEKLNAGIAFGTSAEFEAHYALYSDGLPIALSADSIKMLASSFIDVGNDMRFGVQPLGAFLAKPLGGGESKVGIDAELVDTLMYSTERALASAQFNAAVEKTNVRHFTDPEAEVPVGAELIELCCRICDTTETSMRIIAQVLDTEVHYSLGAGESGIEFGAESNGEYAAKYLAIENLASLLAEATESIRPFMVPEVNAVCFGIEAAFALNRGRLLGEMDGDGLASYDNMTLKGIDYVII